jgi:hypothetical protein
VTPDIERARKGWAEALEGHPFVTADELVEEIKAGTAQWWPEARSDVFTRVHENGVLELGPVSGSLVEMINVTLPKIETWARAAGLESIHIQAGREGWERALRPHNYEVAAVILRKSL